MGMFDYVIVTCPHCKEICEQQTKNFDCIMQTINLDEEIRTDVGASFHGEAWKCDHCNKWFCIDCGLPHMIKLTIRKATEEETVELEVK